MIEYGEVPQFEPRPERLTEVTDEDLARLAEILPAAFRSITVEDLAEFIPMAIGADTADVLVTRNEENEIVCVTVLNVDFGAAKLRGRINDVATHNDYQRQGHAAMLLDAALHWFKARGVRHITLISDDETAAIYALCESRGFSIKDTNYFELNLEE